MTDHFEPEYVPCPHCGGTGMQPPESQAADPESIGLILRVARKQWGCCEAHRENARECAGTIFPGEHYVEYVGEVPAYQSGDRYCTDCANRCWGVRVEYWDDARKAALVYV